MNGLALPNEPMLDQLAEPGEYVVLACERAKEWLTNALQHGDIESIVELRSQADAIRIYTAQKQLGKDAELAATEIVRRAERGIGLAIRAGQEKGEIARTGQHVGNQYTNGRAGQATSSKPVSPTEFASMNELRGSGHAPGIYDLADSVADEDFDEAIEEAKADGNLSRSNVVRKIRGEAKPQGDRHEVLRGTRRLDHNRIVDGFVTSVAGVGGELFNLIDYSALDPDRIDDWVASLSESITTLTKLRNNLKKETTQ